MIAVLQRDQRTAGAHEVDEGLVQLLRLSAVGSTDLDLDAGLPQLLEAVPGHQRIGIVHGRDDARDARLDQGVGAGRVRPWCEQGSRVDIQGGAARLFAGLFERDDFGVFHAGVGVEAAAHHFAIAHQHGADQWIGAGQAHGLCAPGPALRACSRESVIFSRRATR